MQLCKRPFSVDNYEDFPHFPSFFCKDFFRETNLFSREANCSLQGIAGGTFLYITFFEVSTCLSFSQNRMISTSSAIFYFQIKTNFWINYKKNSSVPSPQILPPELNSRNNRLWKVLFVGLGFALMCCIVLIWVCIIKLLWVWSD